MQPNSTPPRRPGQTGTRHDPDGYSFAEVECAADLLATDVSTIRALIVDGKVTPQRIGKKIRVCLEEIERHLGRGRR